MSRSRSSLRFPALEILYVAVLRNVVSHIPSERQIILKINMMFRLAEEWVVPEKIHTPPTEEISAVRRGRGDKIVSDNSKCIRTSEGGRGVNFQFPPWGWYGCFLE